MKLTTSCTTVRLRLAWASCPEEMMILCVLFSHTFTFKKTNKNKNKQREVCHLKKKKFQFFCYFTFFHSRISNDVNFPKNNKQKKLTRLFFSLFLTSCDVVLFHLFYDRWTQNSCNAKLLGEKNPKEKQKSRVYRDFFSKL